MRIISTCSPAALMLTAALLTGCGLKGDLYLEPAPEAEPAGAESAPAEDAEADNNTAADELVSD